MIEAVKQREREREGRRKRERETNRIKANNKNNIIYIIQYNIICRSSEREVWRQMIQEIQNETAEIEEKFERQTVSKKKRSSTA